MSEWTKKDGTTIAIKDMTTSHIRNAMNMLENNVESYKNHVLLKLSLNYNNLMSEHALDAIDHEESMIERMDDESFLKSFTKYGALKEELSRRDAG